MAASLTFWLFTACTSSSFEKFGRQTAERKLETLKKFSGSARQNNANHILDLFTFSTPFITKHVLGHAVWQIKRPFDVIFSSIMLSVWISNFERITYCLVTWKSNGVIWLG